MYKRQLVHDVKCVQLGKLGVDAVGREPAAQAVAAVVHEDVYKRQKLSCFSDVMPESGWNQCVKWVAPFSMAHSFMALSLIHI